MGKNTLSDTDYTKGYDNRFANASWIGKVSEIVCDDKHANVRVIMPDRMDHNGTPLISKPIPVLQIASRAKKSFAVPRIGDNVLVVKLTNTTSDYLAIGSFYTSNDPPPVTDPMLDFTVYDDGSTMQFDANNGQLDWNLKGDYNFKGDKDFNIENTGDVALTNEGDVDVMPQGDVTIQPDGDVTIQATTIRLIGHIIVTGNIDETGVHHDSNGFHTTGLREMQQRIAELERQLVALQLEINELRVKR